MRKPFDEALTLTRMPQKEDRGGGDINESMLIQVYYQGSRSLIPRQLFTTFSQGMKHILWKGDHFELDITSISLTSLTSHTLCRKRKGLVTLQYRVVAEEWNY